MTESRKLWWHALAGLFNPSGCSFTHWLIPRVKRSTGSPGLAFQANHLRGYFRTALHTNMFAWNCSLYPTLTGRRGTTNCSLVSEGKLKQVCARQHMPQCVSSKPWSSHRLPVSQVLQWLRHPRTLEFECVALSWFHAKVANAIRATRFRVRQDGMPHATPAPTPPLPLHPSPSTPRSYPTASLCIAPSRTHTCMDSCGPANTRCIMELNCLLNKQHPKMTRQTLLPPW
jgi:hypothetical protein